jgi:hypothetical protein
MCEKMSVYAGEKRDQVNILRLCCGCGVCGVFSLFACCGCGVCGVFAAVLPRQYLHPPAKGGLRVQPDTRQLRPTKQTRGSLVSPNEYKSALLRQE